MISAKVTFTDGRTATIQGEDREAITAAVDEYESSIKEPEPVKPAELLAGLPEAGLSLASSVVAEPVAGISGLISAALPGEPGAGARAVENTREALTFQPRSEAGQKTLGAIGSALQPVGEALQAGSQATGDAAFNAAGGEGKLAAGAGAAGQVAFEAGIGAIPIIGQLLRKSRNAVVKAKLDHIGEKIKNSQGDKDTAGFGLDDQGNAGRLPEAEAAMRQGFDDGVIAALNGADGIALANMSKMITIAERGAKNARYGTLNRPSDVVGDSLAKRINHVKKANREGGAKVDREGQRLKGQPVDVSGPVDSFIAAMRGKGVKFDERTGRLDFADSDIEDIDGPQKALGRLVSRMRNTKTPDAYDAHRLKKYIDENVTFGKSQEGLGGETERIIKGLRHDLNASLGEQFPAYRAANAQYSATIDALNDFQTVAGQRMNLFGDNADKAIGTLSRRLMSNAQSRVNLLDAMEKLDEVAATYGGQFSDDLIIQAAFVDEIGRVFGAAAKTSLQGDLEKGASTAIRGNLREAAIDAAVEGGKRILGKTDEKGYRAMKDLLERLRRQRQQNTKPGQELTRTQSR